VSRVRDHAVSTFHGVLWIGLAKVIFILTSYSAHALLPRFFGSIKTFARFASVMNVTVLVTNVLIVATTQTVSRFITQQHTSPAAVQRFALRINIGTGAILTTLFAGVTMWLTQSVWKDASRTPLLLITGLSIWAYALYAVQVGTLNGQRHFARQARLDIVFSAMRTVGVLVPAALGLGVMGTAIGFTSAAFAITVYALATLGTGTGHSAPVASGWLRFSGFLGLYQLLINGLMQVDLVLMESTLVRQTTALGSWPVLHYVGIYRAAQTFGFIPYQLLMALAFVLFPSIARSIAAGNKQETQRSLSATLRIAWILALAVAAPLGGAAWGVMRLVYPAEYQSGAYALQILVFSQAALALFVVTTTALNGAGKPGLSCTTGGLGMVLLLAGIPFFISQSVGEIGVLQATAWATLISTGTAALTSLYICYRHFAAALPLKAALRVGLCGALSFGVSRCLPQHHAFQTLMALGLGGVTYVVGLVLTREVTWQDWVVIRTRNKPGSMFPSSAA